MIIVLVHAFIGWALCAATMGIGMATMTVENALIVHAIMAPIFFTIISLIYFQKFNDTTPHWGHKEREDGKQVPIEVLAWVRGREVDLGKLQHLFQAVRFDRTVNCYGFVSIQRYYVYAEQGLSRKRVSIWI